MRVGSATIMEGPGHVITVPIAMWRDPAVPTVYRAMWLTREKLRVCRLEFTNSPFSRISAWITKKGLGGYLGGR